MLVLEGYGIILAVLEQDCLSSSYFAGLTDTCLGSSGFAGQTIFTVDVGSLRVKV